MFSSLSWEVRDWRRSQLSLKGFILQPHQIAQAYDSLSVLFAGFCRYNVQSNFSKICLSTIQSFSHTCTFLPPYLIRYTFLNWLSPCILCYSSGLPHVTNACIKCKESEILFTFERRSVKLLMSCSSNRLPWKRDFQSLSRRLRRVQSSLLSFTCKYINLYKMKKRSLNFAYPRHCSFLCLRSSTTYVLCLPWIAKDKRKII